MAGRKATRLAVLGLLLLAMLAMAGASAQPSAPYPAAVPPGPVQSPSQPGLTIPGVGSLTSPARISTSLQILALLTVLTLAPAILMMLTSFVRIVVVLGFVRNAIGTQNVPPNQVILGLALFLTFFVMAPTWQQVNNQALQPYIAGQLTPREALDTGLEPIREFLFAHCRKSDLALFVKIGNVAQPRSKADVPTRILIPAFLISELKTAFIIGFLIYVPFLVVDMVIASILLSMGMMMLPPVVISLPFKILLFVLVDGWSMVVGSLVRSF